MTCCYCGKQIKDNAAFCRYCGKATTKTASDPTAENKKKKKDSLPPQKTDRKKRKTVLLVCVLIAVLLAVIGIVVAVYAHRSAAASAFDENNIGEVYFHSTETEHIAANEKGMMYADNEILLVANDSASYKDIEKLAKSYNAEIVGWIEQTGDYQLQFSESYSETELNDIILSLEKDDRVSSACINSAFQISENNTESRDGFLYGKEWENDLQNFNNCKGDSWGIEAIEALAAWDVLDARSDQVKPVKIGLVDNGFDTAHEDLGFAETFYLENGDHGTHVAGTMAAKSDNQEGICGVYPYGDGNLYGVSYAGICSYSENGSPFETSMFLKIAYSELILRNVKVINSSLGFNYYQWPLKYTDPQWSEQVDFLEDNAYILADFLQRLLNKGYDFVLVNAAGNDSDRANNVVYDSKYNFWTTVIDEEDYPDVYNRIIVVGAVNSDFEICNFSNGGDRVDIYAPGDTIFSTVPGNKYENKGWSGTSMAAPHVSGIAAMVWSLNNELTGSQVKELICRYRSFRCTSCNMADAYLSLRAASDTLSGDKAAETDNGGILCWVVDAANEGTGIENALVTVTNLETGKTETTLTDSLGHFEIILPEGKYSLTVQAEGYQDYTWPNGNEAYSNPIVVQNKSVNYLDDWIKMVSNNAQALSDSMLVQKNYYDRDGVLIYYDSYAYYDNGLLCSTTLHSVNYSSGTLSYIGTEYTLLYLYDENGNLVDTVLDTLTINEWYNRSTGEIVLDYVYDENGNSSKVYIYPKTESIEQEKFGVDSSRTKEIYGKPAVITTDVSSGWAAAYLNEVFAGEEPTDLTSCRFIYVDNNTIPELWMDYGYGYAGAEVYTLGDDGTDRIYISHGIAEWIEKENLLLTSGGLQGNYNNSLYKIENGKFVLLESGDYNDNVQFYEQGEPISVYRWNDSTVSAEEYEQNLNNAFDKTRATDIYQNIYTYEQGKMLLQSLSSATATVMTEAQLRELFHREVGTDYQIEHFFYDDYDGDNRFEAFAVVGDQDEFLGEGAYTNAKLYYIDASGVSLLKTGLYGYPNEVFSCSGYRFLSLERSAGGSGSTSYVFGVRNGVPQEMNISGQFGDFGKKDGHISGYYSDFSSGSHDYIYVNFVLDPDSFTFNQEDS